MTTVNKTTRANKYIIRGIGGLIALIIATTAQSFAQSPVNISINAGYAKGNGKFNIVVKDTPSTKLDLYVNGKNIAQATVNKHDFATFSGVKLSGTGKLSFTKVIKGKQKSINYTRRYTVSNGRVSFSSYVAAAVSAPATKPKYLTFGNGTFKVGSQVQPGTYRTRTGTAGCYYARLSGFSGDVSDILDNENTDYPAVVTILPTDVGFESQGCGTWTTNLSVITKSQTTFSNGVFIVGTDIQPGTYQTSGQDGCYYARLSGFSGDISDIIDNENPDGSAIVTIASTDAGFTSQGCGTWAKQ